MSKWGERIAAPILAATAAAWWAYALVVLQPQTEAEQAGVVSVGNNAYWVRDVRWTMILLALVAFVWACRGDRVRSAFGAVGALVWVGVDLWLDRIDLAVPAWQVAVPAGVLAAAACAAGGVRTPKRDEAVLILAAATSALTAGVMGAVQSPTDTETGLNWSGVLICGLATLFTLGCAASVALRRRFGAAAVVVLLTASALIAVMWQPSPIEPALGWTALVLAAVLLWTVLTGVWTPQGGLAGQTAVFLGAGAGLLVLGLLMVPLVLLNPGAPFTRLAGNPPVNGADSDSLHALGALLAGLAAGALINRIASRRVPTEPASA